MLTNLTDRNLLMLGAVLCLISAWCTIGYHHPDEHFQIWEFANYKLGHIEASALPWEFPAQMRPGLQPFMAYNMVLISRALGINNPFIQVFLMRVLCGAAALWVYWKWTEWLQRDLNTPQALRWMRIGLLFFWLMPYLNIRFSSENTSAISFFAGILLLVQHFEHEKHAFSWKLVASGLLLGLSFFFRYQIAFAGIGLGAWILIQQRPGWWSWISLTLGAMLALGTGLATDFWLYGEWVCAPYNYFFSNIVEGKAAGFGVSPFWWYLTEMPIALLPPLSLALLVFVALGLWQKPLHVLTWCVVPFVLAHSLVGHKEVRFLFPMALPFFFFASAGWEGIKAKFDLKPWMAKCFRFLVVVNMLVMLIRIFIPAKEMAAYYRFLWHWNVQNPGSKVYFVQKEPVKNVPFKMPFFENPANRPLDWYTDSNQKNDTLSLKAGDLMLCPDSNTDLLPAPKGFKLQSIYAYYPEWLLANNFNNWQERTRISVIYQLKKTE